MENIQINHQHTHTHPPSRSSSIFIGRRGGGAYKAGILKFGYRTSPINNREKKGTGQKSLSVGLVCDRVTFLLVAPLKGDKGVGVNWRLTLRQGTAAF